MRRKLVFLGIALALAIPAASMAGGSDPAVQQSSGTITQQAAPTIRQTTVLSGSHAIARLAAYTLLPHHFVWLTAGPPNIATAAREHLVSGQFDQRLHLL